MWPRRAGYGARSARVPGIAVALLLARSQLGGNLRGAMRDVFGGKSVVLLRAGIVIGAIAAQSTLAAVEPVFLGLFPGLLTLFLLDLGARTGERLGDVRKAGPFLAGFALVMPIVLGSVGFAAGFAAGLSNGGVAVLAVMAVRRVVPRRWGVRLVHGWRRPARRTSPPRPL